MTKPRLLYMGYGHIGRRCLRDLVDDGFEVVGVFCRATDRGSIAAEQSVYGLAREVGLEVFAATDPGDAAFLHRAAERVPHLLLSVQYDRILKPSLLAIPTHGSYNLHFGPLPRLRGCFPTKWAIINDEPAGVTFHCIDPGIDSGDVIDQEIVPLASDETDASLYQRLQEVGYQVFRRQLAWMRSLQPPKPQPQDARRSSYYPKRLPHDGVIEWSRDARWIERFVRAYTFLPHPGARTVLAGREVELVAPTRARDTIRGSAPGEVHVADGRVLVACGSGALEIERVKIGAEIHAAGDWLLQPAGSSVS